MAGQTLNCLRQSPFAQGKPTDQVSNTWQWVVKIMRMDQHELQQSRIGQRLIGDWGLPVGCVGSARAANASWGRVCSPLT